MKKILQLLTSNDCYDSIRINTPLNYHSQTLRGMGIHVETVPIKNATVDLAQGFDLVCVHGAVNVNFINLIKSMGVPFCIWMDDLMIDLPQWNPAVITPSMRRVLDWCFENAQSVVCTTKKLKEELGLDKALVVGNLVAEVQKIRTGQGVIYAAGNSHEAELRMLNGFALNTQREFLVMSNSLPPSVCHYHRTNTGNMQLYSTRGNIGSIEMTHDYEKYRTWMNNLHYAVGLAPLEDNRFNRCKSIWKFLEYTMHGAVSVVSDVGPYSTLPNEVCVKAQYPLFGEGVEQAFAKREEIFANARNYVLENYTFGSAGDNWIDIYERI